VQFGAALATKLFHHVGPAGAVTLRLVIAAIVLGVVSLLTHDRVGSKRGLTASDAGVAIAFGLVLAAMKYIDPIIAAMMHVAGSLLVVFNSARLVRHGEELDPYLAETSGATAREHRHAHA